MFQRIYDRWKREAREAFGLLALAAASIGAAGIALGFVCAAAFIFALERYGPVDARLAGAAVFLAASLVLLAAYAIFAARRLRKARARALADTRSSLTLADPRLVLLGLQIAQAIGVRRLLPLAAFAAVAFALGAGALRRVRD